MGIAIKKPDQVSYDWISWIAYNLAANVNKDDVILELQMNGYSRDVARSCVSKILTDPVYGAVCQYAAECQKWANLMDGLGDVESESQYHGEVPRLDNLSTHDFRELFYTANRPVIITGVVNKWPALHKWTLSYLHSNYGSLSVNYQAGRDSGTFMDNFSDHGVSGMFFDFLRQVQKEDTGDDIYLTSQDALFRQPGFSKLLDDVIIDDRYFDKSVNKRRMAFWMGPKNSMSHMHRDIFNVGLAQIVGRKKVVMVSSKHMHHIYNEHSYYSDINFDDFDIEDYPLLKNATLYETVLEPGELLFIPLGWWHFIKSLDVTISVSMTNFKFKNEPPRIF